MGLEQQYAFRRKIIEALVSDLLGPHDPGETLTDAPLDEYVMGILFPQSGETVDPAQHDDEHDDSEGDELTPADPAVAMANLRYPSSMGLTFAVDAGTADAITVKVEAARYVEETDSEQGEKTGSRRRRGALGGPGTRWRRAALAIDDLQLDVTRTDPGSRRELVDGLELFSRIRDPDESGARSVTLALINTFRLPAGTPKDANCFFQPRIHVEAGETPAFVERKDVFTVADEELAAYRLLYRHAKTFAVGHGCSASWATAESMNGDRALTVESTFTPEHNLLLADSNPDIKARSLELAFLVDADRAEVMDDLRGFCGGYREWVEGLDPSRFETELVPVAEEQIRGCREAAERMLSGVELLVEDDVWRAFRLANQAMLDQRARVEWLENGRPAGGPDRAGDHVWRPFQLAFILLCLRGISQRESPERLITDLLWFPTGGGKTEAYLGLIAFTVFLRRLRRGAVGGGVTALMRYTLRLLTIQQFERAALLICTCEAIRRAASDLGNEPITIGLWVGQGATPNDPTQTRKSLDKLHQGAELTEANPVQLHSCPWCGTPLDYRNYYVANRDRRLVITCRQDDCLFKDELPAMVVDEDIYRRRPSLIIATADKFASLPWRTEVKNLFNLDAGVDPPELIIQDELHLISGPLGTLTGLYETAVDLLCSTSGVGPKVIASTATIRRARRQGQGLFARDVRQFPPPAVDARNSYFAVEMPADQKAARLYLGLMAPGTSHTSLMIRVYAGLLEAADALEAAPEIKDPYWTLVGYFNSLRVLGGARMAVQDDVGARVELLAGRANREEPRHFEERIELTSREPSADIPRHLKRMSVPYDDAEALDVILATNMISVGVDINRLGLLVMMGQPQATSEYIQSTSRVGRRYPGLVVTLFNAGRSRDRSHYEAFAAYHSALYRQVESTSVTPFSSRARDRGLHAVFIGLARLLVPEFADNGSASKIEEHESKLEPARRAILARVERVSPDDRDAVAHELDQIVEDWKRRARDCPSLKFSSPFALHEALLIEAGVDDSAADGAFPTLWSLRDVDRSSSLYLVR
jgi:hypothetical protein